jgi:hypothetical protein
MINDFEATYRGFDAGIDILAYGPGRAASSGVYVGMAALLQKTAGLMEN